MTDKYCPFRKGPDGQDMYYECTEKCGAYNMCHGLVYVEDVT